VGRDQAVFRERIAGAKLADIAARHDLSIEGVRVVFARRAREVVDWAEQALLDAAEAELRGEERVQWPFVTVPHLADPGWVVAHREFEYVTEQLRERGHALEVFTEPVPTGTAMVIRTALKSSSN